MCAWLSVGLVSARALLMKNPARPSLTLILFAPGCSEILALKPNVLPEADTTLPSLNPVLKGTRLI